MNQQKRILAINDISCFGKCSLAAAVPILSVAGVETCMLPTAVLSAHTAFEGFTFRELTEDMLPQAMHWKTLGLSFDAVYSGYLGSAQQVACVEQILDSFPTETVLIDPVMGDNGMLYTGFDEAFVMEMRSLLKRATVIVPNVTEAAYLTDVPYEKTLHSEDYIQTLLTELKKLTKGDVVLTGLQISEGSVGTAVFAGGNISVIERERFPVFYSGTGDVFASSLAAAMLRGFSLEKAAEMASDFIIDCILETRKTSGDRNYGVNFELCLPKLLKRLGMIS